MFCWAILGVGVVLLAAGCAGKNASFEQKQVALTSALDALRQANFDGEFDFNEGGSLLGVNAATNWSLGPAQSTLHVSGKVDFTKAPRAVEGPPAPPK